MNWSRRPAPAISIDPGWTSICASRARKRGRTRRRPKKRAAPRSATVARRTAEPGAKGGSRIIMAASAGPILRSQRGPSGSQTRARTIPPILQRSRSLSRRREAVGPRRGVWAAGSNFWSAWLRAGRLASMPKYPLEPLAELRRKKVEAATAALAEAVRKREAAARALRGAEVRRDAAARAAAAVRTAELEALGQGQLHARDLARAHAWAARAAAEQEALAGV